MIAEKWDISRDDMEAFAVESPPGRSGRRPTAASRPRSRRSTGSIVDEGPREPNVEKIRSLPDAGRGRPDHRRRGQPDQRRLGLDAHRSASRRVKDHGLTPRARIHHMSVRGDDPIFMLTAPDPGHPLRPREDRA